jgi:Right handed beta helix region
MPSSMLSVSRRRARLAARLLAAVAAAGITHDVAAAATLPTAPQTFDTTYAAPSGKTLTVAAGGNLQAALNEAELGDTIVLEAGATFTGRFTLPNKTTGSGWIYVVSSQLASLPSPGQRVGPNDAVNMPKIVSKAYENALVTVANSHHFRFVGIEFAPVAGGALYALVVIGNLDTSPATLPHNIVFDRCYVHGDPTVNDRRGIEMDGAYVAVVDSYISDFQEAGFDSQGLWAFNTTGPLQIRDNYIEAAGENVMFGGADSREAALVPANIEISNNYFFKPLSLLATKNTIKNLLEFKSAKQVLVTGNVFQNNPLSAQNGFAILITPRNGGNAPWSVTSDIAITNNTLINVGSGFNVAGQDNNHPSLLTERILIRDNLVGVTGLNGADGRALQFLAGGNDYTVDHNTIINSAPNSTVAFADSNRGKITNFVFTNNLATRTAWGFFGSGVGEGTRPLNTYFTDWTFSKNVLVGRPAGSYPAGNFFPTEVAAVGFANYAGGNYLLSADSPYKSAATDGTSIGVDFSTVPAANSIVPSPPGSVVVR